MKSRFILSVILMFTCSHIMAQNVGIGLSNPSALLHLKRDQAASTGIIIENTTPVATADTRIVFTNDEGPLAGIMVANIASTTPNAMRIYNNRASGHFTFHTAGVQRLYIGNDGRVGIGNNFNTPSGIMHVRGVEWASTPVVLEGTLANGVGPTLRFSSPTRSYDIIGATGSGAAVGPGYFAIWDDAASAYRFMISPNGNVGIGISSPNSDVKLHVTTVDNYALYARNSYAGNSSRYGIYAASVNAPGYGYGIRTEGGYMGGYFEADAPGYNSSIYGVYGFATGSGGTGTHYGVYGFASGGSANWAGYFSGNMHVTGTLSKAAGTFRIDHPADPANKILSHSFVESPDMMNVYAGVITTGANGEGIVELPSYFQKLNINYTYHLTVMGGDFAQAILYKEIGNNQFTIKTNQPNVKVSWMVTGVRNDPYAQQHRVVPEEDKKENRGKYLNPEVYGLPMEKSIAAPVRK